MDELISELPSILADYVPEAMHQPADKLASDWKRNGYPDRHGESTRERLVRTILINQWNSESVPGQFYDLIR